MTPEHYANDESAKGAFKDAYNKFVGRGSDISIEQLSEATDIGPGTLRGYMDPHGNLPDWRFMARLFRALPVECVNMILAPIGLEVKRRTCSKTPTGPELSRSLSERLAMLLRHYEDGFEDHKEEREAVHELHILQRDINAYIAEREKHGTLSVAPMEAAE